MNSSFITSIEHFKPHIFQAEQGEGLFMSHTHGFDELTLILDGEGYYSSNEQNIKVEGGDLILIPSQLHHGFVCIHPWKGISVHFKFDQTPPYCQFLFLTAAQDPLQSHIAHLQETQLNWANSALLNMEREWKLAEKNPLSYDILRNSLETALLLFHRNATTLQTPVKKTDESLVVDQILKEIHQCYNTSIKVREIASRHFMSESSLRKKFLEILGVPPKQYILNLRLEEAKRLLKQTNKTIEYISFEVGFTSSSRFHELFVKSEGVTPLEWRKQNQ